MKNNRKKMPRVPKWMKIETNPEEDLYCLGDVLNFEDGLVVPPNSSVQGQTGEWVRLECTADSGAVLWVANLDIDIAPDVPMTETEVSQWGQSTGLGS